MTLEEIKAAALSAITPRNDVPAEFKQELSTMSAPYKPKDQWDRGQEPGLNELSGVDVLREPKAAAMNAAGPGGLQALIDALVPTDIGPGMMKGGLAGAAIIKPKTKMKDLKTPHMDTYNKDTMSKAIGESRDAEPRWKSKMKK